MRRSVIVRLTPRQLANSGEMCAFFGER